MMASEWVITSVFAGWDRMGWAWDGKGESGRRHLFCVLGFSRWGNKKEARLVD